LVSRVYSLNILQCTSEQCLELCHSSLGIQCEVLDIRVQHRESILDLINRMKDLRGLTVDSEDEEFDVSAYCSEPPDDELLQ
jgi:hypothetical protein